jgi:hypothetical protein
VFATSKIPLPRRICVCCEQRSQVWLGLHVRASNASSRRQRLYHDYRKPSDLHVWSQSGFQTHVRSAFWIAPLMSLAPNSPLHFSTFLKNHFPVNLSRSKSQYVSNIFWQMFYNQNVLRKIWVNTVFWLPGILLGTIFADGHHLGGDYFTCQWSLENLDPYFSCNLTSNQSKCL